MNPLLYVTVGLPRSGKSTWARRTGYPVVNPDSIRLALHGQRYLAESEPLVWGIAPIMVRSLFLAGHHTVVLDATNLNAERRKEWLSDRWGTQFVLFDLSMSACIDRARAMGDEYIIPVIIRMASTANWTDGLEEAVVFDAKRNQLQRLSREV